MDATENDNTGSQEKCDAGETRFTTSAGIQHDANQRASESIKQPNLKNRLFGIPRRSAFVYQTADDYELKYQEDAYGEEAGATARVWRTYLDEAQKADIELIEGWRDTTDVLLVFAGLFSAVVATFVVQTSAALQPNYSQITAYLLFEQNSLMRAAANHTSLDNIPFSPLNPNSNIPSSTNDRWVNGLWFTSLSVSLVAAFIAVLVKQWTQHYQSVVFGTPREQVRIRQFRFLGVERWHMPLIIGTLPMFLHLALLLYFAGLVLFLIPLEAPIAYTVFAVSLLAYGCYFASNLLPLWYPMCPYKTPLSSLLASCSSSILSLPRLLRTLHHSILPNMLSLPNLQPLDIQRSGRILYRMKDVEKAATLARSDDMDAEALAWLYSTSSNPTVINITVQAISGLRFGFSNTARDTLKRIITFEGDTMEHTLLMKLYSSRDPDGRLENYVPAKLDRFLRACHQLGAKPSGWYTIKSLLRQLEDPTLKTLRACHIMLCREPTMHHIQTLDEPKETHFLETYDYTNEGPQPFLWSVLLRRGQPQGYFKTPLDCWLHGFRVMYDFLCTGANYDPPWGDIHQLRMAMMLEYFCSLSNYWSDTYRYELELPVAQWGCHSVLNGSPFLLRKVLPQIYSTLSIAIQSLHGYVTPQSGEEKYQVQNNLSESLWHIVSLHHMNADDELLVDPLGSDAEDITKAAIVLRREMQSLVESNDFWADEPWSMSRDRCCQILFEERFWPSFVSCRISWTPELMEWFLRSNVRRNWFDQLNTLYEYFSQGNPDIYQVFENKDGLVRLEWTRHGDAFLQHYLDGLLHWKGTLPDRIQHLDYLYHPENLAHVVQECILVQSDDGVYAPVQGLSIDPSEFVSQLFLLRPPGQYGDSYGQYLGPLRGLVKDHRPMMVPLNKPR